MKTKRTRETIIEIERVRVVCQRTRQIINDCPECRAETDFVTVGEAARIIQTDAQTISRLTETGVLHRLLTTSGDIYICLASIERFGENRFN